MLLTPDQLLAHGHTIDEENDMKARNMLFNIDGLGVVWYTSSNADFELGNTVRLCPCPEFSTRFTS